MLSVSIELTVIVILTIIGQMLLIKTITSILKVSAYIITSIAARPTRFVMILAIISVSTLTTAIILYIFYKGGSVVHTGRHILLFNLDKIGMFGN
jgi:hypothetical protein